MSSIANVKKQLQPHRVSHLTASIRLLRTVLAAPLTFTLLPMCYLNNISIKSNIA